MFQPQHLSNTVWAYATLGLLHCRFIEAVAEEVERMYVMYLFLFSFYICYFLLISPF